MRKGERLTKGSDFQGVYGSGKSIADRFLVLYVLPYQDELKLGISVSKKVSRASVGRNRLKRLARESFREIRSHVLGGYHLVVILRVAAKDIIYQQVLASMERLIKRAGLWVDEEEG